MKKSDTEKKKVIVLRKRAEEKLKSDITPLEKLSDEEVRNLAHELQVHQVELEMQNDELRKAQVQLEESRHKYSDLYDFSPVGYFTISEKGLILEVNLTGASILGVERSLLIKKPLSKCVAREDQDIYYLHLRQVFKTGNKETCEVRMSKKKGTQFYAQLESIAVQDNDGNLNQCRVIISDITGRKQMEDALLQSEKLKAMGVITSGIAHEFNNILAIISGKVQLLELSYKDNKRLMDEFHTIRRATDDGAEIVHKMFEFTKVKSDISGFVSYDIGEMIKQAIDITIPKWKNMAQARGISYHMNLEGLKEIPSVMCNPSELRGVFVNIINNALDAMPGGGTISFRTWRNADTVFVSITDTGAGMTEEVQKRIFDPFFTTRVPEGTGLGMSVVYGIIARHCGKIEVESELGKGSTITLGLQVTKGIIHPEVLAKPIQQIKARNLRILVVDDKQVICEILNIFFSDKGHKVRCVDNGTEAIKLLKSECFDLVLCDLILPEVSGNDVIKVLNTLDKRPKVGLITGWGERVNIEDLKVDFIIKKPFNFSELSGNINNVLNIL